MQTKLENYLNLVSEANLTSSQHDDLFYHSAMSIIQDAKVLRKSR